MNGRPNSYKYSFLFCVKQSINQTQLLANNSQHLNVFKTTLDIDVIYIHFEIHSPAAFDRAVDQHQFLFSIQSHSH